MFQCADGAKAGENLPKILLPNTSPVHSVLNQLPHLEWHQYSSIFGKYVTIDYLKTHWPWTKS